MTTRRESRTGATKRTRRTVDRNDPKVRLLALVFATRDDEVKQGDLKGTAAHKVPPTIAKAVARMLREIGEDPKLGQDLVLTVGPSVQDPATRQQHEDFVTRLTDQLALELPDDPLQGMTVVVQRRAKDIVGAEAAAVRRRASSSSEQPPPDPTTNIFPTTRRSAAPTQKVTGTASKTSRGRRVVKPPSGGHRAVDTPKPVVLGDVFVKAMATALKRLAAVKGPDFNQLTFLELALEGYQTAWAAEKRKSSQGLDAEAARAFEDRCGDTYRLLREEAVRLGVPAASFTVDDMHRILKMLVQKLGLIVETMAGHVHLKAPAMRKTPR